MTAKVKICGLMRPEDAVIAARAGAAYLGAVFAAGPRTVTRSQARELVAAADAVPVFGVFGEQPVEDILQICASAGLSGAQLHGSYSRADASGWQRGARGLARRANRGAGRSGSCGHRHSRFDAVWSSPRLPSPGWDRVSLDLAVATQARERLSGHTMVLAGGLTPESVSDALALVRPEIVDVSSGVERRPGRRTPTNSEFRGGCFAHSPIT